MIGLFSHTIIVSYSLIFKIWIFQINCIGDLCPNFNWKRFKKHQSSPKQFFPQNHWLNNRCFRKCVSKCSDIKYTLQIIFEAWIFVAWNIQQKQTDLFACCRQQNSFLKMLQNKVILLWETLEDFLAIFKNMFLLQSHDKNCSVSSKLYSSYTVSPH